MKMADVKSLRCVDELKTKVLQTKETIRKLDEEMKKHSWGGGRSDQFTEGNNRSGGGAPFQRRPPAVGGSDVNNRLMGLATGGGSYAPNPVVMRRGSQGGGGPPMIGRGVGNAFSRLGLPVGGRRREQQAPDSGDEAEDAPVRKSAVQSSVIATPRDEKSRQDMIAQQSGGKEGKARNKRMFGLLMGTLVQFKQEEQTKTDQVQKRKAVELKLEEKQREQKEQEKAEHRRKLEEMREGKRHLRHLEQKVELADLHTEWEEHTRALMHSVRTESKPHIYFVPKLHNDATVKKVAATRKTLEAIIEERRKLLEQDIEDLATNTDDTFMTEDDHLATGDQENNAIGLRTNHHAKTSHRSRGDTRKVVDARPSKKKDLDEDNHSDLEPNDVVNLGLEVVSHIDQEGSAKTGGKEAIEDMDVEGDDIEIGGGGDMLPKKYPEEVLNSQMEVGDISEPVVVKSGPAGEALETLDAERSDMNLDGVTSPKNQTEMITEKQVSSQEEEVEYPGQIDLPKVVVDAADKENIATLAAKKNVKKDSNGTDDDSDSEEPVNTASQRKRSRGQESGSKGQRSGSKDVERERSSRRKKPRRDDSSRSDDDSEVERQSERKRREKRRHHDDDDDQHRRRHGNEKDSKRRKDVSKGRDHSSSVVKPAKQERVATQKKYASSETDSDNNDVKNESLAQK